MTAQSMAVARLRRAIVSASLAAACAVGCVAVSGLGVAGAAAAGCPNEALRTGPSAALPGCRAYEMVSPVEKFGANVSVPFSVHVAPGGGAASFFSSGAFAGAQSSSLANAYLSRRDENWVTESLTVPQLNREGIVVSTTRAYTPDLAESLAASRDALTPGAIKGGSNLYLRDNATGALTLVAATAGGKSFALMAESSLGSYFGGTNDWSHIAFLAREPLPPGPGEPEGVVETPIGLAAENLYDYTSGRSHIVDVLPDGTVPAEGVHQPASSVPNRHLVSADGSRIFFQVGESGAGPIFMREDDTTTTPVSISHNGAEAGEVKPAEFGVATADGSVVYFSSSSELLEGSENEGAPQLYAYNVASGTTTELISDAPEGGPRVEEILGASEDGSYVYFTSAAVLAEGATPVPVFGTNIYVWHDGTIKWIAQTGEIIEIGAPKEWALSPDGRNFAFASYTPIGGEEEDPSSPSCPFNPSIGNEEGHCQDVYEFEYESGVRSCLSCTGKPARGDSSLGGQEFHEPGLPDEFPHALLNDGTVFLDTPNRLLPPDVNGVEDVYAWRDGSYELISTGTSDQASTFGDATADGSDILFRTSQALVPQDVDKGIDVYDDREAGGLASQSPPAAPPPPCEGEGCRVPSPTPPAGLAAGSMVAAAAVCGEQQAVARASKQHANSLGRRARKAAKGDSKAANAKARNLRRQATAARKRANQLQKKAKKCGGSK
jgi:hypothetical protein